MTYEVYALNYGSVNVPGHYATILEDPNDPHSGQSRQLAYYVWLIRGQGRNILVDCGFDHDCAAKRGRRIDRLPDEAIAAIGTRADEIDTVVVTHLHYDHAGNFGLFPNAEFLIQDREIAFAASRYMRYPAVRRAYEADHVCEIIRLNFGERVRYIDGDAEIAAGITVHLLPGHAHGLMAVQVPTKRGRVFLASDVAHFYDNIWKRNPFLILQHVPEYCDSHDRMVRMAESPDHIIPGHDPLVMELYPKHPDDAATVDLTVPPSRSTGGWT
ncbi:MAG TPA: N-acyl homoserine lactonase family protein [Paracoccaceae bacterium]|nr:N-acyl homoserine lactonase family protein [Paracoccaceae bacterium]